MQGNSTTPTRWPARKRRSPSVIMCTPFAPSAGRTRSGTSKPRGGDPPAELPQGALVELGARLVGIGNEVLGLDPEEVGPPLQVEVSRGGGAKRQGLTGCSAHATPTIAGAIWRTCRASAA